MEATRIRFMANALAASGCMFVIGLVCAPMMRYWHWVAWPALGLVVLAGVCSWRAYRIWGRWLAEAEARDREAACREGCGCPHCSGMR